MNSFKVAKTEVLFNTKPDLFSPKGLDMGTQILLECLTKFPFQSLLDWGCGWGAIGLYAAKINPGAEIMAIDSDIAAVKITQENIELNQITNLEVMASHSYDDLDPKVKFDIIASNPPTHRGREVVDKMIIESKDRLKPGGTLLLVVEARIKPWVARQMKATFNDYKIVKRGPKNVVLMAQKAV